MVLDEEIVHYVWTQCFLVRSMPFVTVFYLIRIHFNELTRNRCLALSMPCELAHLAARFSDSILKLL